MIAGSSVNRRISCAGNARASIVNTDAMPRQNRYRMVMLLRRLGRSFAPQKRAVSTLAPMPMPIHMK